MGRHLEGSLLDEAQVKSQIKFEDRTLMQSIWTKQTI